MTARFDVTTDGIDSALTAQLSQTLTSKGFNVYTESGLKANGLVRKCRTCVVLQNLQDLQSYQDTISIAIAAQLAAFAYQLCSDSSACSVLLALQILLPLPVHINYKSNV